MYGFNFGYYCFERRNETYSSSWEAAFNLWTTHQARTHAMVFE